MASLYNGVSGIKTYSYGIDVTSDNIANVNTIGHIASNPEFKSVFYQNLPQAGINPVNSQIGLGATKMTSALETYRQGAFQNTDGKFDMAIAGDGFFGVTNNKGDMFFTRNGDFIKDKFGDLVNQDGLYLLGTMNNLSSVTLSQSAKDKIGTSENLDAFTLDTEANIKLDGANSQSKISLPEILYLPPVATSKVDFKGLLSAEKSFEYQKTDFSDEAINKFNLTKDATNNKFSISGNINDDPAIASDFQIGDEVEITLSDGVNSFKTKATPNKNGEFEIKNLDAKNLGFADLDNIKIASAATNINKEISTKAQYQSEIYASDGEKKTLQLDFSKVIPSQNDQTAWKVDASIQTPQNVKANYSITEVTDPDTGVKTKNLNVNGTLRNFSQNGNDVDLVIEDQNGKTYELKTRSGYFGSFKAENLQSDLDLDGPLKIYEKNQLNNSLVSGEVVFNGLGALVSNTIPLIDNDGTPLEINLGSIYDGTHNKGFDGIIMSGTDSIGTKISKNGAAEGILKDYDLSDDGDIVASFDNGKFAKIAKVALYHFQNDQGLSQLGANIFSATPNSGEPVFFTNEDGEVIYGAQIKRGVLEMSNVDLATELTNLIVMQKAYDASSKSITTSNEILETIIGIKK